MATCEYCGQVILDGRECTCEGAVAERKKQKKIMKQHGLYMKRLRTTENRISLQKPLIS